MKVKGPFDTLRKKLFQSLIVIPHFFILLSSFDSILHYFYIYIIWLKKYSIVLSKFLTRIMFYSDFILFFLPSSSIADSVTVWLDTCIKIIVICRDIHHNLRKLQQLTGKKYYHFFFFWPFIY